MERIYNIIYNYRVQRNRYYFVENDVATFNNPHFQPEEIKEVIKGKVPEFSVTSSNNKVFNETVFGGYSGKELIAIMDKQGLYRDYERPEKIIPIKVRDRENNQITTFIWVDPDLRLNKLILK